MSCKGKGTASSGMSVIITCCLMTKAQERQQRMGSQNYCAKINKPATFPAERGFSSKQKFSFTLSTSAGGFAALILCMRTDSSSSSSSSGSLEPLLSAPADDVSYKLLFVDVSLAYNFCAFIDLCTHSCNRCIGVHRADCMPRAPSSMVSLP